MYSFGEHKHDMLITLVFFISQIKPTADEHTSAALGQGVSQHWPHHHLYVQEREGSRQLHEYSINSLHSDEFLTRVYIYLGLNFPSGFGFERFS